MNPLIRPLFQMLLSFRDFKAHLKNLKRVLNIDEHQISMELELLKESGIAQMNSKGDWKIQNPYYYRPLNEIEARAEIKEFHRHTLQEAQDFVDPHKFRSIYLAISEDQIPVLSQEMDLFLKKLRQQFATENVNQKKLVKMNVQFYSLTEVIQTTALAEPQPPWEESL